MNSNIIVILGQIFFCFLYWKKYFNYYKHNSKTFILKNIMVDCTKCFSINVKKHWLLKSWWQRYYCKDCSNSFTVWWLRWTYSEFFKHKIIENYCHKWLKAREMIKYYNISSRTLVKRAKEHKKKCLKCLEHKI